jgi:hypothetical protein
VARSSDAAVESNDIGIFSFLGSDAASTDRGGQCGFFLTRRQARLGTLGPTTSQQRAPRPERLSIRSNDRIIHVK